MKSRSIRVALGLTLVMAATAAAPAASDRQAAAGRLGFQMTLRQSGPISPCPGRVPLDTIVCVSFTGTGPVRGLGNVSMTYTRRLALGPEACPGDFAKPLSTTGRLSVAGKGKIRLTFAEGAECVADWFEPQQFTVTGGTGRYAAASGRGTREPDKPGTETWTGTLVMPGLAFDLTAPKLHGAGSKTVRAQKGAKSARVTFNVTATDGVDGTVPVSCRPRSGSRFEMGRTTVRCRATDSSANTARAAFAVTVRRGG
jgi:hypothetical protein